MKTISLELERAHHASQMDKKARRKAGKGEEGELWNTCTTNVVQSIVAVCVCVILSPSAGIIMMMMMMIVELECVIPSPPAGLVVLWASSFSDPELPALSPRKSLKLKIE